MTALHTVLRSPNPTNVTSSRGMSRACSILRLDWDWCINRSDPLQTWRSGVETIGNDVGTFRRFRTLDNCLKSGPVRAEFHPRKNPTTHGSYLITLFDENSVILKHIAEYWRLQRGSRSQSSQDFLSPRPHKRHSCPRITSHRDKPHQDQDFQSPSTQSPFSLQISK